MFVVPPFAQVRAPCQDPLGRTWRRNANFRHGRWSRYRQFSLERRISSVIRQIREFSRQLPWYASFGPKSWPNLEELVIWVAPGRIFLPRKHWRRAVELLREFYEEIRPRLRAWAHAWREMGSERAPDGFLVLALMFFRRRAVASPPARPDRLRNSGIEAT